MELKEQLNEDMKQAMRAKDKIVCLRFAWCVVPFGIRKSIVGLS